VLIIVLVHVDNCTIVRKGQGLITRFKVEIAKHIDISDLGDLHWILGIEVLRIHKERTLLLSQRSYIDSILRSYGFEDLKPVSTPMDANTQLTSAQSPSTTEEFAAMRNVPYHEGWFIALPRKW
jgi:Reverse transcriptase (RNA-dependent DNA polymerase)